MNPYASVYLVISDAQRREALTREFRAAQRYRTQRRSVPHSARQRRGIGALLHRARRPHAA